MDENIEVNVKEGINSLEILKGQALPKREPLNVKIEGLISAPFKYIQKRVDEFDSKKSHILVDRDQMTINLIVDEKNHYKDTIQGKLKINPDFEKWKINTGISRNTHELADFIKMNRAFFANRQKAMELVSTLKNFEATIDSEIENKKDERGNRKVKVYQAVKSNIPSDFTLKIPLFKGTKANDITVEISIDANDLSCSLVSPDAKDFIIDERDEAINNELHEISNIAPNIVIIEV